MHLMPRCSSSVWHMRQYVEQYNALVQALGPRLWATASELEERALKEEPSLTQVTYRLADQLDDLCREFRRRAIATEQAFINAIRPALTEEQLGQLRTVAHESMRRNCRSFHSTVRWVNVELRPIWLHVCCGVGIATQNASNGQCHSRRMREGAHAACLSLC
jgi:hypothetical protein